MPTLLNLEVSPRGDRSISRALGKKFITYWQQHNPDGVVISRDLNASRIPYMDNDWIAGVYAPPEVERTREMRQALALSSELIAELQAAAGRSSEVCGSRDNPPRERGICRALRPWKGRAAERKR